MKNFIRLLIALLIIITGILSINVAYAPIDTGLFSEFLYLPFIVLIIVTIVALIANTIDFRRSKKAYQYLTSFIGVTLCAIVIFRYIHLNAIGHSKTVLVVTNLPGAANVLRFEFKEDGNFRLTEYDLLGQTIFYGKYARNKDILTILSSDYNGSAGHLPQTGSIHHDSLYCTGFDTMLVDRQ